MSQLLHLLIVDRERAEALATMVGSRWLLPAISCPEHTRASPLAARWLAERGLSGHLVGQWLGRLSQANNAMDWLVVLDADPICTATPIQDLHWLSFEYLKSSPSLLDYQRWAVATATVGELPSVTGPFGSMTWCDRVQTWLESVAGPQCDSPLCYNVTPYEVTLRVSTGRGVGYFKGLSGDRIAEASITSRLSDQLPESFARTLAFERQADGSAWWLMAHCPGTTLATDLTLQRACLVGRALGRIQQHLIDRGVDLELPDADLASAATWALSLLSAHVSPETAGRCDTAIASARQTLNSAEFPRSWIPLDLDAGNVLIDGESVRFIDLDDSRVGVAPFALSTMLRRVGRQGRGAESPHWIDAVHRAYEESWIPPRDAGERWADLDVASILIDGHLGWQRLVQKTERGEVHGVIESAAPRTARRLARALGHGGAAAAQGSR
jgi:hypothetical protein